MSRGNVERGLIALCAALTLAACSTTPQTELSWNVRERKVASNNGNTFYGPAKVSLPPVQQKNLPPLQQKSQTPPRATVASVQKTRRKPGWYTAPVEAQPAPHTDVSAPPAQVAQNTGAVRFRWPLAGRVVLDYGSVGTGERNDGINIAANSGAEIHAAAAGTVSYCGNELRGYGNLVLIQHDDGYLTAYAHVGSISVNRGDRVAAGQAIATVGATGDVSSPQLHFEIRRDRHPVDPRSLLPKGLTVASS